LNYAEHAYTTGCRELDELISKSLYRGALLIVGHPGAGKTTLASQICYANAKRGKKCLYVTFYEDKEKLFKNTARLGIDLASAELVGLFKYVKLPAVSVDEFLSTFTGLLEKEVYDVVVIDSVNPVLERVKRREEQRAILLNFFYQLTGAFTGLLVLVAEVPLGKETVDLGSIEFVTDAVIYLKHRVEYGLLSRVMELRKLRGAPISVVEVPFLIVEGGGIRVFKPPRPERVLTGGEKPLHTTISIVPELVGLMKPGDLVYISYPPRGRTPLVIVPLLDLAVTNDMKTLIISYKYALYEVRDLFIEVFKHYFNVEPAIAKRALDKYFYIVSFNPSAYSYTHLQMVIAELIERVDPGIVAFHGGEIFRAITRDPADFWVNYINMLLWLKNKGKLVFRYCARVDPYWTRMHESLSDIVVRVYYSRERGLLKPIFYIWRRGSEAKVFDYSSLDLERSVKDVERLVELIKQRLGD